MGLEIVPNLYERSLQYTKAVNGLNSPLMACPTRFHLGDIYDKNDATIRTILNATTVAVCFATTWSQGSPGRKLPKLSAALTHLPKQARVVVIDGLLDTADGFDYQGELRLYCPDTAPYSTAFLYLRQ